MAKAGWTSAWATRLCPSRSIDLSPRHNTHLSMLLLCRGSRARTLKLTLQKYYQTCLLSNSFSCPQSKMLGTVQILKEVCLDDFCCLPLCRGSWQETSALLLKQSFPRVLIFESETIRVRNSSMVLILILTKFELRDQFRVLSQETRYF